MSATRRPTERERYGSSAVHTAIATAIAIMITTGACAEPSSDPDPDPSASDTTAQATSASDSTGSATTTESTGAPPGDGISWCVETCMVPVECCLPGTPCPGPYPNNVDCIGGLCTPAVCVDDTDCAAVDPASVCRDVRGTATCIVPCTGPTDCTVGTCDGVDDAGTAFCFERCDAPGQFCGNQTCDVATGLCVCTGDGQCQSDWLCLD